MNAKILSLAEINIQASLIFLARLFVSLHYTAPIISYAYGYDDSFSYRL